jgi:regulator of protease activity HflC (stomatin/prohibitin superfamily)
MNVTSSPLIQELTPDRFVGWMLNFVDAGYKGLLVKNGKLVRQMEPGLYLNFALPWLEQCKILLVDTKARNLEVSSQGDFLSRDHFIVNVSLNVTYQVLDPKRIALQLSEPLTLLSATLKDLMGLAIARLNGQELIQAGRTQIREYLLTHPEDVYQLGFQLEDVRINDITFPETRGILRQAEGMSARQEATFQAELQMGIAKAGQPQMNVTIGEVATEAEETIAALSSSPHPTPPPGLPGTAAPTKILLNAALANAATRIDTSEYCLVNQQTGQSFSLMPLSVEKQALTIGRELDNDLIIQDSQCSRHHAQITYNQGVYYLTDVGSANGTLVNGNRLLPQQPIRLEIGMTLNIGTQIWHFEEKALPATKVDQRS